MTVENHLAPSTYTNTYTASNHLCGEYRFDRKLLYVLLCTKIGELLFVLDMHDALFSKIYSRLMMVILRVLQSHETWAKDYACMSIRCLFILREGGGIVQEPGKATQSGMPLDIHADNFVQSFPISQISHRTSRHVNVVKEWLCNKLWDWNLVPYALRLSFCCTYNALRQNSCLSSELTSSLLQRHQDLLSEIVEAAWCSTIYCRGIVNSESTCNFLLRAKATTSVDI